MRLSRIFLALYLVVGITTGKAVPNGNGIAIRQESSDSGPPPLSGTSTNASPSPTDGQSSAAPSGTNPPNSSGSSSPSVSGSSRSNAPSSTLSSSTRHTSATPTITNHPSSKNGTSPDSSRLILPLQPRITPALGIAGVILLLSGMVYALIGVKNRWIHVFLSTAYLTSLSILVLIVYVMNPPVSDAIQGAYFVGILMTGLIFGCGALIFKEVTEGLGCLLGGFTLAMWFLTLKEGGLMTSTLGKGIFIAIFCVVCWAFSFSHYTRAYALIGSTSFSGSTAFILGIDCFSRGGLKEFWVYLWDLNDNLFPLNTRTYPITRGTRVESIVIILGCIIGIISQIKLWKVVRSRNKEREAERLEDERQKEAMDEALGRHLQRQNDRDRSEWEKRYGDRLAVKRNRISFMEAHGEKRLSTVSAQEVGSSQTSSSDSLEMSNLNHSTSRTSLLGQKGMRQSIRSVQAIPEVEEDEILPIKPTDHPRDSGFVESRRTDSAPRTSTETPRSDAITTAESNTSPANTTLEKMPSTESLSQTAAMPSLRPQNEKPRSSDTVARLLEPEDRRAKKRSSIQSLNNLKRRSIQSLLPRSKDSTQRDPSPAASKRSADEKLSESKEALVTAAEPVDTVSFHSKSRASSIAATIDEEHDTTGLPDFEAISNDGNAPQIVISPVAVTSFDGQMKSTIRPISPQAPALEEDEFDVDPEELMRPSVAIPQAVSEPDHKAKSSRNSQEVNETGFEDGIKSVGGVSQVSNGEGLTKGALQRVPSQLSNVVLSYRTNEWAKHIANADAPVFEEPESVTIEDQEAPTHLADPTSPVESPLEEKKPEIQKPPELPSPVNAVAPSNSGIKVNPDILPPEKTYVSPQVELPTPKKARSRPTSGDLLPGTETSSPSVSPEFQSQEFGQPGGPGQGIKRSMTDPSRVGNLPRNQRRMSNPTGKNLQSMIIDEDTVATFTPTQKRNSLSGTIQESSFSRTASTHSNNLYQTYGMSVPDLTRSMSPINYPSGVQYSGSMMNLTQQSPYEMKRLSGSSSNLMGYSGNPVPGNIQRSFSSSNLLNGGYYQNMSSPNLLNDANANNNVYPSGLNPALLRSSTRLTFVENSHQPISRHNALATDQARREQLMADWRLSNHQSATVDAAPKVQADTRRAQMMQDRDLDRMRKENEQNHKARNQAAFDQGMRSQGMIDAHREMMKKMQMQANRKLTN